MLKRRNAVICAFMELMLRERRHFLTIRGYLCKFEILKGTSCVLETLYGKSQVDAVSKRRTFDHIYRDDVLFGVLDVITSGRLYAVRTKSSHPYRVGLSCL